MSGGRKLDNFKAKLETLDPRLIGRLREPLKYEGTIAVPVAGNTDKWKALVETFKIVSEIWLSSNTTPEIFDSQDLDKKLLVKQPLVAIGGFAMFLFGDTARDAKDIDFWTSSAGSEEIQNLLSSDKRFTVNGPAEIEFTDEKNLTTSFDLVVESQSTPGAVERFFEVIDDNEQKIGMCAAPTDLFKIKLLAGENRERDSKSRLKDYKDALFLLNNLNLGFVDIEESVRTDIGKKVKELEATQKQH